jgi:uncharacterized small protein (DUF1192 family)
MSLTAKQEAFAQAVARGLTQADAYREAFNVSAETKPETVYKRASELMSRGEIAGRIEALRAPVAKKAQITLEKHLEDLMVLRNAAVKDKKWAAAIQAEIARGKAAGIYVEKHEHGGPGGGPIPVTSVPVDVYLEARKRILGEF